MSTDTIKQLGAEFHYAASEDLLRQALGARKCDGDHNGPLCADKQCWLRDPEEAEQPTMSCPSCKREYPDFDSAGVVFCDPKQGGCGFCRHVELKGQPMGDKTVMVCTACWEAPEEEQPKPAPEPCRGGLPPERLRKVWAEWEDETGIVYVLERGGYRCKNSSAYYPYGLPLAMRPVRPHGATWAEVEAKADEAEKPAEPKMLNLTKLPPGTVCEATADISIVDTPHVIKQGQAFRIITVLREGPLPVEAQILGLGEWWLPDCVPARVVKEGGEQ